MSTDEKLILALDVADYDYAVELIETFFPLIEIFKVGLELHTIAGLKIIEAIHKRGKKVFLDLKFHDIPTTVAKAGAEATKLNVSIFDLHALGGFEMMRKTVEVSRATAKELGIPKPLILAITILTSMDEDTLNEVGIRGPILEEVGQLALLAMKAGMDGVVASPKEIGIIRQQCGEKFLIVTPGIRLPSDKKDDQKRTMSPKEAITAGATYLVIGRPIKEAKDPLEAVQRIVEDIS